MLKDSESRTLLEENILIFILAAVQFAHIVDFVVLMPLGPMLMRTLSIGPIEFASLVSSYNLSAGLFGLAYGVVADRFNRKYALIFCFLGFIIATTYCGFTSTFSHLLIGRIIAGCFGGTLSSIVLAIVSDVIPYTRRGKSLGIIMSAFSIASIIGVPLGLSVANMYSWHETFFFISGMSLMFLIPIFFIIPSLPAKGTPQNSWNLVKRLAKISFNPDYFFGYLLMAAVGLTAFMIIPFLSPYAINNIGIKETELKYLYLFGGCLTVVTAQFIGKATDKYGAFKTFTFMALLSIIPIYLYTNAGELELIPTILISSLFMSFVSGRFIPCMTMATALPLDKDRGGYMAVITSIRSFSTATATLIGGLIVSTDSMGKLVNFNITGYIAVALTFITIYIAHLTYTRVSAK